jgi:hypothetical protein
MVPGKSWISHKTAKVLRHKNLEEVFMPDDLAREIAKLEDELDALLPYARPGDSRVEQLRKEIAELYRQQREQR